jgi:hypothetical protein
VTRGSSVRWRSRSCPTKVSADAERRARFNSEAKAVAALSHPNILAIHDFGDHDGAAYAVMELLEGQTLRERLSGGGAAGPQSGRDRRPERARRGRRSREGHRPPRPEAGERLHHPGRACEGPRLRPRAPPHTGAGGHPLGDADAGDGSRDRAFSITRDGRSIAYLEARREGDIWLADFGGAGSQP